MNDPHDGEDIILSELPDDELVEQMHDDLYDGLADEIAEGTQILLDRGWEAPRVLDEALVAGMTIVGTDFREGILFVPEVLMAANAMKAGMAILKPILADTGVKPVGKVVIGTVKGDIHDIGKNLVGMMMEGAGFEVIDIGINVEAGKYIAALEEHRPDILGMSALLTTTMPYMKVVIDALKEQLRSNPQEVDYERHIIMRDVYEETGGYNAIIRRARLIEATVERKKLYIDDNLFAFLIEIDRVDRTNLDALAALLAAVEVQ